MMCPVSVCHQVSTMGQRLWPMTSRYHIQASGLMGSPTVPSRRRLSSLCFSGHWSPHLHEGADGGRRGVENIDLVAVDHAPEAIGLGEVGGAFVHQAGGAVLQRAVDDVAVAGDPADIGGAPVDVFFFQIEDPFRGEVGADGIAAGGVHNAFGFAGGAGGVEDVKRMFGVERLGRAFVGGIGHQFVPPVIAARAACRWACRCAGRRRRCLTRGAGLQRFFDGGI